MRGRVLAVLLLLLALTAPVSGAEESAAPAAAARYHRVVKGDTLWALAGTYGLSLAELIVLNPQIKNPNLIYVGDEVRVK